MGTEPNAASVEDRTVSGNGAATAAVETEKSRRALLKGLGVAAAGAVVGGILSPREAAAHGTLHVDSDIFELPAIHGNHSDGGVAVRGDSTGFGSAIQGASASGFGVDGRSHSSTGVDGRSHIGTGVDGRSDSGTGVNGDSNSGTGVKGHSVSGTGVEGRSDNGVAVDGFSDRLIGVNGSSNIGMGVNGSSDSGIGVIGTGGNVGVIGDSETGTGVLARNFGNGLALDVHGPAKFSTAGAGTIPAQQSLVVVNDSAVTAGSHITMTLTGDPGSAASGLPAVVVWIERQPGVGFIARLSRRVASATPFTYLIVEPG